MSATELKLVQQGVKELTISELLEVQEAITNELKLKTTQSQSVFASTKPATQNNMDIDAKLPPEMQQELSSMSLLNDKALWKVARSRIGAKTLKQLNELNHKQQKEGQASLTKDELDTLQKLVMEHGRSILVRANAAALLKERGYDVSGLGPKR